MYENFIFLCRSVEDVNQEASKKFHLKFLQHMAPMEDSLNRFVQDSVTFSSGLQTNLGMFQNIICADVSSRMQAVCWCMALGFITKASMNPSILINGDVHDRKLT